ncbi:MAG: hypothetical protein KatS3mg087_0133 [Patescibacteria group bacterium]|nr:MAG: hypothetical protein KatS3mg087_0133 [Patescibacteria group bacterium]
MSDNQKVPRLTEKTAQKILDAAQDAEQAVKAGSSVDAALAQAASKHGLSKEQTKLLVQGWNIEKSLSNFSKTANFFERVNATPPIAHYDVVISLMNDFSKEEPKKASSSIWEGYYSPPKSDIFDTAVDRAAAHIKVGDAKPTTEVLGKHIRDKLAREHLYRQEVLKKARDELEVLKAELARKKEEVKWAFRAVRAGFDDVAANLKVVNPYAYRFLVSMKEEIPQDFEKEAFHVRYNPDKYPYKTVLEAADIMKKLEKLAAETEKLEAIDKALGELKLGREEQLSDPTQAGPGGYYYSDSLTGRNKPPVLSGEDLRELEKEGGILTTPLHGLWWAVTQGSRYGLSSAKQLAADFLPASRSPDREFENLENKAIETLRKHPSSKLLSQLGTSANLSLILARDPELANYPLEDVAEVYTYLEQLAPQTMKNPLVARTILKQALSQGGLGTFDIEFLTKIEKEFAEARNPKK